jgi:hypothetical protein
VRDLLLALLLVLPQLGLGRVLAPAEALLLLVFVALLLLDRAGLPLLFSVGCV